MTELTAARVRELFVYNRVTGILRRLITVNKAKAGDVAGSLGSSGALQVPIDGKMYLVHRVMWLWVYDRWPRGLIDHINLNPADNRWCNLRPVNYFQNLANSRARNTEFGHEGLPRRPSGRIQVNIRHNGRRIYLGTFSDLEIAKQAYARAARLFFGEFARVA